MSGSDGPTEVGIPLYDPVSVTPVDTRRTLSTDADPETDQEREPTTVRTRVTVETRNETFRNRLNAIFEDPNKERVSIITISAGGEYGAFGAGFLNGLAAANNDEAPVYDIVTGVSTGSLLAPLVFLGREKDYDALREQYTTVTDKDLLEKRSTLAFLASNSFYKTNKLLDRIRMIVNEEMVREIAAQVAPDVNRRLAVLSVNVDTGASEIFDITAIAAGEGRYADLSMAQKVDLIVRVLAASSAIPLGLEPQFIDGEMYVDGGARQHVFVGSEVVAASAPADASVSRAAGGRQTFEFAAASGVTKPVDLHILVNGDFRVTPACAGNSLLGIGGRTASVVINQLLWDSVQRLTFLAEQMPGWSAFVADARPVTAVLSTKPEPGQTVFNGKCVIPVGSENMFNKDFMRCMYEKACIFAASRSRPWTSGLNALPSRTLSGPDETLPARCRLDS